MEWVKHVHWLALFIAFLGPVLTTGVTFEWLINFMVLLGIIVALATYNSGTSKDAVLYLLIASLAFMVTVDRSIPYGLMEYMRGVVTLGAWYVMPIAVAQGWKALIG